MPLLTFTIPGDAKGKGRPRAARIGAHLRLYTDAKTLGYENLVRYTAAEAMNGRAPFACPLVLQVTVHVTAPKSASLKAQRAMVAGEVWPAKKPDLSNILKAIEDGMNSVAFRDDAQIVRLNAEKRYGLVARVEVELFRA